MIIDNDLLQLLNPFRFKMNATGGLVRAYPKTQEGAREKCKGAAGSINWSGGSPARTKMDQLPKGPPPQ